MTVEHAGPLHQGEVGPGREGLGAAEVLDVVEQELGPGPGLDWSVLPLGPEAGPDEVPHSREWLPDQPCNGGVV